MDAIPSRACQHQPSLLRLALAKIAGADPRRPKELGRGVRENIYYLPLSSLLITPALQHVLDLLHYHSENRIWLSVTC